MWRLTCAETGYKKFLTSEWLVEMKTSDPADPAQHLARLYVPLQSGQIMENGQSLYTLVVLALGGLPPSSFKGL